MTDIITPLNEASMTEQTQKTPNSWMTPGNIAIIAGILVAAVIFGIQLANQNRTQPTEGKAPEFSFTTFDGESYELADFRGQIVVLNFWASWCAPCRVEAPDLQSAWENYRDKGVVFLGIAYADNGPRSLEFINEFDITYLNAPDLGTRISQIYNIQGVPETFIIDREGNVAKFLFAGVTEAQISQVLDELLLEG